MTTYQVDAMWFRTLCACGWTYLWHREHKNQCPRCLADFGYLVTLDELREEFDV